MVVKLNPQLETVLNEAARKEGVAPEAIVVRALRERYLAAAQPLEPRDEWERRLLAVATDCGVSLSHDDVSSESLYD